MVPSAPPKRLVYINGKAIYTPVMAKHLVDIDEDALSAARVELGTTTIKDTVNEALRSTAQSRDEHVSDALDLLASADLHDRSAAWR
jgi:Arc/MetJ family transcription regulator